MPQRTYLCGKRKLIQTNINGIFFETDETEIILLFQNKKEFPKVSKEWKFSVLLVYAAQYKIFKNGLVDKQENSRDKERKETNINMS